MASDNSIAENNPTPDAGPKSDKQPDHFEPEVAPALADSQPPPSHRHCKVIRETEKDWWDKLKPFVEIAGVALLAVYTGYTIKMYSANKQAADAAQASAEAAGKAAKTADDTLNLTFRPRIAITSISQQPELNDGQQLAVSFEVSNYGPTAARNLKIYRFESVSLEKDASRLQYGQQPLRDYPKILAPNKPTSFGIYGERVLSPEQINSLRNRKLLATFSVLMEYEGNLPGTHHAEVCILFTLPPKAWWTYCPWPAQND